MTFQINPDFDHVYGYSTASLLLSLNTPHKMVQELLGHANIGVTMDIYSHSMPALEEEGIAKLDTLLGA